MQFFNKANFKILSDYKYLFIFLLGLLFSCQDNKNTVETKEEPKDSSVFIEESMMSLSLPDSIICPDSACFFCVPNCNTGFTSLTDIAKFPASNLNLLDTLCSSKNTKVFNKTCDQILADYVKTYTNSISNKKTNKLHNIVYDLKTENKFTWNEIQNETGNQNAIYIFKQAILKNMRWKPGQTLKIKFLDGTPEQQQFVKDNCTEWLTYANIKFEFGREANAEIRIAFNRNQCNKSRIGKEAISVTNPNEPTMYLYDLTTNLSPEQKRGLVLHEFGHVLGLVHEHQLDNTNIQWNISRVYDYFSLHYNQDEFWVNTNILIPYNFRELEFGKPFDRNSIMIYPIPAGLANIEVRMPLQLSSEDKNFVTNLYPKP